MLGIIFPWTLFECFFKLLFFSGINAFSCTNPSFPFNFEAVKKFLLQQFKTPQCFLAAAYGILAPYAALCQKKIFTAHFTFIYLKKFCNSIN